MNESVKTKLYITRTDVLKDPEVFAGLYEILPEYRKKKVDKVKPEEEKKRSLAAGILLMRGLRDLGIDPYKPDFAEGPKGKPYLRSAGESAENSETDGSDRVFFNLSHSGDIAIALFSDIQSGCDVERIRQQSAEQLEKLANRFFSEEERRFLEGTGKDRPEAYAEQFTQVWTLKESYIKAMGDGLSIPLDSFTVIFESTTDKKRRLHNAFFEEFEIDSEYKISCCYLGRRKYAEIIEVDINQEC